jgi:NTP pyrophosphatase (non-canonical NTP hydrolase)
MDLRLLTDDVETISRRYAEVYSFRRDDTWFLLKLQEEVGELTQAYLMRTGQGRAKGLSPEELDANFRAEIADVLCQLLLLARHHEVDVEAEVERKWLYRLRPS